MDDFQLDRNLRSVGKECFVAYFEKFCDENLSNEDIVALIEEERGYSLNTCRSRTGGARGIIKSGRAKDALEIVKDSARVEPDAREKAARLFAQL